MAMSTSESRVGTRRSSRRERSKEAALTQAKIFESYPANLVRKLPVYDLVSEEGLDKIEEQAEWILSEIGIKIVDDPIALQLFKDAGATVQGESVKFDKGHVRALCATAPKTYTMYARNPEKHIEFGGNNLVFSPVFGPPFVRDLEKGRRSSTLADLEKLIKLTHMIPWLHHQGGAICEPNDIPVNKRHLDMLYAHIRYSDKAFMGSSTAPTRGQDCVEMARLVFGADYMENHMVIQGVTNVNSPLVFDAITTSAIREYASANQGNLISPFILAGAMSPVTPAAALAQAHAETTVGIALSQLVRPGAPAIYSAFLSTIDLKTGAPTFGTPEANLVNMAFVQLGRRMGLPIRSGAHLTASKIADAQAMQESADSMNPAIMSGTTFFPHAAGWLEGGLTTGFEKFIMDAERLAAIHKESKGLNLDDDEFAQDAFLETGPGDNFLSTAHTMRHYRTVNHQSELADSNSFEQWRDEGSKDMQQRAYEKWTSMLEQYKEPTLDAAIDEALQAYILQKKESMPDAWY